MTTRGRLQPLLLSIAAVCAVQIGAPCGPGPQPSAPCTLRFDEPVIIPLGGGLYEVHADVLVDTGEEVQAYDLTISWDPTALDLTNLSPHPEFDDDSQFALPVTTLAGPGSTTPVVDLRHGPSATGTTRVASIVFIAPEGLPGWISVSGTVAGPDGSLIDMTPSDPVNVP